jgi:hypothetical protein
MLPQPWRWKRWVAAAAGLVLSVGVIGAWILVAGWGVTVATDAKNFLAKADGSQRRAMDDWLKQHLNDPDFEFLEDGREEEAVDQLFLDHEESGPYPRRFWHHREPATLVLVRIRGKNVFGAKQIAQFLFLMQGSRVVGCEPFAKWSQFPGQEYTAARSVLGPFWKDEIERLQGIIANYKGGPFPLPNSQQETKRYEEELAALRRVPIQQPKQ